MSAEKQQILETITTISRLITLAFKPIGTKISIRDHKIILSEPTYEGTYFNINTNITQSIDRYWYGDSRGDIYVLNHVIRNFVQWYIIPNKQNDKLYVPMINMAKYLCVGLKKLQKTYGSGIVTCAIQYYIIVLVSVIEDKYYPEMIFDPYDQDPMYGMCQNSNINIADMDDANDDDNNMCYSTIFDMDKIKSFWSMDELLKLANQFDDCFKDQNDKEEILFDIVDIDEESKADNNKLILPIAKSKNAPIVMGHLVSIAKILDTMDKKFTGMLSQSIKGTK